jgi:hypothetical protein
MFGICRVQRLYRIEPQYTGVRSLDGNNFIVIYEVTGGEDGPPINNFEDRGDSTVSYRKEESISASSSGATLTAKGDQYLGELNMSVARGPIDALLYVTLA